MLEKPEAANDLLIENLTAAAIPEVVSIEKLCGLSIWGAESYRAELTRSDSVLLAAQQHEKIVGFILMRFIVPEAEIMNIGVLGEYRRQNIGARLLQTAMAGVRERGVREIFLEVREDNRQARSFYRKHGFEVIGKRPNFYRNPSADALLMRRIVFV